MPTEPMDDRQLMTPAQVSALLQVPCSTLAVWRATGREKIAFLKVGRLVRYRPAEIEAYLLRHTHDHDPE